MGCNERAADAGRADGKIHNVLGNVAKNSNILMKKKMFVSRAAHA